MREVKGWICFRCLVFLLSQSSLTLSKQTVKYSQLSKLKVLIIRKRSLVLLMHFIKVNISFWGFLCCQIYEREGKKEGRGEQEEGIIKVQKRRRESEREGTIRTVEEAR